MQGKLLISLYKDDGGVSKKRQDSWKLYLSPQLLLPIIMEVIPKVVKNLMMPYWTLSFPGEYYTKDSTSHGRTYDSNQKGNIHFVCLHELYFNKLQERQSMKYPIRIVLY